jgi:hypothetical protein
MAGPVCRRIAATCSPDSALTTAPCCLCYAPAGPAQIDRLGLPVIDTNNMAQQQLQLRPQPSVEITDEQQQVSRQLPTVRVGCRD